MLNEVNFATRLGLGLQPAFPWWVEQISIGALARKIPNEERTVRCSIRETKNCSNEEFSLCHEFRVVLLGKLVSSEALLFDFRTFSGPTKFGGVREQKSSSRRLL